MSEIIEISRSYAMNCHSKTNHLYDGQPYVFHLDMVVEYADKYMELAKQLWPDIDSALIKAAAYPHDTIEDARQTYNDVKRATNEFIAEVAYACTNEKGKDRSERANGKYYQGIRATPVATYIKICDRLANMKHSFTTHSDMIVTYTKENYKFHKQLYMPVLRPMFDELNSMCLVYEDQLPENLPQEIYDKWFKESKVHLGLRMGFPITNVLTHK